MDNDNKNNDNVKPNEMLQLSTNDLTESQRKDKKNTNILTAMDEVFQLNIQQQQYTQAVAKKYQLKHGMSASIPILCKGGSCPYIKRCSIPPHIRDVGGVCLQEVGAMLSRFESLCDELGITEMDVVDIGLVKDVVDIEMMLIRIDNKFALNADVMTDAWQAVDHLGKDHWAEEVHPLITVKLSLYEKKMKMLEKLNSTRKDKADEQKKKKDPGVKASALLMKAKIMSSTMTQHIKDTKDKADSIDVENTEIHEVEYEEVEITNIDSEDSDIIELDDDRIVSEESI